MRFPNNLLPWGLLSRAFAESRRDFVEGVGEHKLLAVRIGPGTREVQQALEENSGESLSPWQARTETTGVGTSVAPISEAFLAAASAAVARREATPTIVRRILDRGAFFLTPLARRRGPSADRLTIGRSNVNDVVLRHPSVSVLHAWVECDDRALLYLGDEGSTNGTQINGRSIEPGELEAVQGGDLIRFGDVECVLLDPGDLWDLVTGD